MKKFHVVLIGGTGKAGSRLVKAIIRFRKEYNGRPVVVTILRVRDGVSDDKHGRRLAKLPNVTVSEKYEILKTADMLFLGIPPSDEAARHMFTKIRKHLPEKNTEGIVIPKLSYSSGLTLGQMKKEFCPTNCKSEQSVLRFTLNTNVDTGNGIIHYAHHQNDSISAGAVSFFEPFSKCYRTKSQKMYRYIAGNGSTSAYVGQFVMKLLREYKTPAKNYTAFLRQLLSFAHDWDSKESSKNDVEKWLHQTARGYRSIGISSPKAIQLSREIFESTVSSFIDDIRLYKGKKNLSSLSRLLRKRIMSVPTKNGCTEKQLKRQRYVTSVAKMIEVIPDMINQTANAAKAMSMNIPIKYALVKVNA